MTINSLGKQRKTQYQSQEVLNFSDNKLLIDLCGEFDRNLAEIEEKLFVQIIRRGNQLVIVGREDAIEDVSLILMDLYERLENGREIEPADLDRAIRLLEGKKGDKELLGKQLEMYDGENVHIKTRKKTIEPRTKAQTLYVKSLLKHELSFGIGPAGTGKTYLAVAVAVSKFITGEFDRIIFSRPAVEAGEKLGYLPGDMKEKVDPYMQPLYDALNDFLPSQMLARYIEDKRIEIAPLAFMRGRTLSHAFVVLDEAQNATSMQMKMFLTRLGEGSRMVVTGDVSQIDLPRGVSSGLSEAESLLKNLSDVGFSYFTSKDVVRHRLVAAIIEAYDGETSKDPR